MKKLRSIRPAVLVGGVLFALTAAGCSSPVGPTEEDPNNDPDEQPDQGFIVPGSWFAPGVELMPDLDIRVV